MKKSFLLLIFLSISLFTIEVSHLYSQQPTQEWVKRFSWNNFASGLSVKLDSMGNVYVLMKIVSDTSSGDFGLVKYSNSGNLIWSVNYNSPGNLTDAPIAFAVTSAGDVYITGYSYLNTSPDKITTVKYNPNGILQWARVYYAGGPGDGPSSIAVDKSGNVIVAGGMAINNTLQYALVIKYNSNGDSLWTRAFTQFTYGYNSTVILDDSNNIYTAGHYGKSNSDYLIIKTNPAGVLKWYATYDSPGQYNDMADYIAIDTNRNLYVIGTTYIIGLQLNNTLLKINNGGIIQWSRIFTGIISGQGNCYEPAGIAVTKDGGSIYYTTFCFDGVGSGGDIVTLKYNSQGDTNWVRIYNSGLSGSQNGPYSMNVDRYNNIYITGIGNYSVTGSDYVTIKYLPSGLQQWVATYNGPLTNSLDYGNDLAIDTNLNVYVTGISSRYNGNPILWDAATIKYSQPSGVEQISSNIPRQFKLGSNYPNPFNPNTKFKFEIPKDVAVKIIIYDIIGREIAVLVNDKLKPGVYEANWNAGKCSSGVYFYSLITESYRETKKAILIK